MLVTDVQTAARDLYNAVSDTFFTDAQINNWITQACNEFAKKAYLIEGVYTTSTVIGTQGYAYPSNVIAFKRITINGKKIKKISYRQDDSITLSNQASTQSGYPVFYTDFNNTIYLRPLPDAVYTLSAQTYNLATAVTNSSTLEIPQMFHFDLVDYCLFRMFAKDKDTQNMVFHRGLWNEHVKDAVMFKAQQKRADSFATVQDEETLPVTILGEA